MVVKQTSRSNKRGSRIPSKTVPRQGSRTVTRKGSRTVPRQGSKKPYTRLDRIAQEKGFSRMGPEYIAYYVGMNDKKI